MNALVLTDSTGYGKIRGSRTQSVFDAARRVLHIISPGSSLSAPGSTKNQRSLAYALAVETNPLLTEALEEDKDVKVIFINACESVGSKQQKKYEQMTRYRKAIDQLETDFTIMSLQSLAFFFICFHPFFCWWVFVFIVQFRPGKTVFTLSGFLKRD